MYAPAAEAPAAKTPAAPASKVASRPGAVPGGRPGQGSFVRAHGTSFVDDNCREFYPTGWNGCAKELCQVEWFWGMHGSRTWPLHVHKSKSN